MYRDYSCYMEEYTTESDTAVETITVVIRSMGV